MDNILENKAKFFAQHWGQMIFFASKSQKPFPIFCKPEDVQYCPESYIELKPLSSLLEDDVMELAKIVLYDPKVEDWNSDEVCFGEGKYDSNGDFLLELGMRCWIGLFKINDVSGSITLHNEDGEMQEIYNVSAVLDFLRSKGYALPWMGLSAAKMVESGWVKLKESKP